MIIFWFPLRGVPKPCNHVSTDGIVTSPTSILEYAGEVWDPHTKTNINVLERVQKRSARFITGDYSRDSSVSEMLQQLHLRPLQERRAHTKTATLYKAVHGLLEIPTSQLIPMKTTTRGHSQRFHVPCCRLTSTQTSFYPDTINLWNSLPEDVVEAPTLEAFRERLQPLTVRN